MSEEFKKEEINGEAAEKTKAAEHTEEVKAETTAEQSAAETEKPQETAEDVCSAFASDGSGFPV